MFDFKKFFDLSKNFALPNTLLKSKNYCTNATETEQQEQREC